MGLFQRKQQTQSTSNAPHNDVSIPKEQAERFFDEYYREELRNRGRWHFENIIKENAALFKQDLDTTLVEVKVELKEHVATKLDAAISQVNKDIKEHVTRQLDQQFAEYAQAMKEAQDTALQSLTESTQTLQQQYQELSTTLQKNVIAKEKALTDALEENKARIGVMQDSQDSALHALMQSVQAVKEQHEQLDEMLQKNVAEQEARLVDAFEKNMAQVIEHYLLGALGDQYDLKAQLPSIIKQMEANKQEIVDDVKL